LYARAGQQHCPTCGAAVRGRSVDEVVEDVLRLGEGVRVTLFAPKVTHRKGEFRELFEELAGKGFVRVRVDGVTHRIEELPALDKKKKHVVEAVIDRLTLRATDRGRIAEAVELGLREGEGEIVVEPSEGGAAPLRFSESRMCCGHTFPELSPQSFSFNSPLGMCTHCN